MSGSGRSIGANRLVRRGAAAVCIWRSQLLVVMRASIALLAGLALLAGTAAGQTYAASGNIVTVTDRVTVAATVDAIDPSRPTGVFIVADGHSLMLPIAETAGDLRALRHGDKVVITFNEVMTLRNLRQGTPGAGAAARQPDLQSAPGREPEGESYLVVGNDRAAGVLSLVDIGGGEVRRYRFSLHTLPEEMWRIAPGDVMRGIVTRLMVTAIVAR